MAALPVILPVIVLVTVRLGTVTSPLPKVIGLLVTVLMDKVAEASVLSMTGAEPAKVIVLELMVRVSVPASPKVVLS